MQGRIGTAGAVIVRLQKSFGFFRAAVFVFVQHLVAFQIDGIWGSKVFLPVFIAPLHGDRSGTI